MIIAKDLMSSPVRFLYSSDNLANAVDLFEKRQFKTMPILSPDGKIKGILSEMGMMKALILSRTLKNLETPLHQFVQFFEAPTLVHDRDSLEVVIKAMTQARSHRLLVVDSNDKLLGVISPSDAITALIGKEPATATIQHQVDILEKELSMLRGELDRLVHHKNALNHFQDLMQSSLFLCHSVGIDGKIRFANPRLHEVLGYGPNELHGQPFTILYPEHIHLDATKSLEELTAQNKQKVMYSALRTKSGEHIKVEISSVGLRDEKGNFTGTATVSRIIDPGVMMKLLSGAFTNG